MGAGSHRLTTGSALALGLAWGATMQLMRRDLSLTLKIRSIVPVSS